MFGRGSAVPARRETVERAVPDRRRPRRAGHRRTRRTPARWRTRIDRRSLSWQENVVVSWTGMRGVVTLAAAAAIPVTTATGEPFPERATIQAIAFVVSVGTLLMQGWTLPLLIRRLRLVTSPTTTSTTAPRLEGRAGGARRRRRGAGRSSGRIRRRGWTRGRWPRSAASSPGTPRTPTRCPTPRRTRSARRCSRGCTATCCRRSERRSSPNATPGGIEDEAVRAMLERLDLQEAGVSARLESRF